MDLDEFDDHESFVSYLTPLIVFLVSMTCFVFLFCKAAKYIHEDMQSLKQVVIFETDPYADDYGQMEENTEPGWADTADTGSCLYQYSRYEYLLSRHVVGRRGLFPIS